MLVVEVCAMNKHMLAKSQNARVQIRPAPLHQGRPTTSDWIINRVEERRIQLWNPGAGYIIWLGLDAVREYMDDMKRTIGEIRYGFLRLKVQLTLSGRDVLVEPIW